MKLVKDLLRPLSRVRNQMRYYYELILDYSYDGRLFSRAAAPHKRNNPTKARCRALIIINYHRFEKGLSLREPRAGFGKRYLPTLRKDIIFYTREFGFDDLIEAVGGTLEEYCRFSGSAGVEVPEAAALAKLIRELNTAAAQQSCSRTRGAGGTLNMTRGELESALGGGFDSIARSRFSIRDFSVEPVDRGLILSAVKVAAKTPSVCNRQAWQVYYLDNPERVRQALELQNGNQGFRSAVTSLAIITMSREAFVGSGERNQCWVDGGLFSMSFVYALHALGLGTCCLNWSVGRRRDRALKNAFRIPQDDAVIMMIAIGNLADTFRVAASHRRSAEDILRSL